MGFADTINDFEHKTLDECRALGVNDSMIHEDFMIGSDGHGHRRRLRGRRCGPHVPQWQLGLLKQQISPGGSRGIFLFC